jgi:ABC-2 type transport system permease protein
MSTATTPDFTATGHNLSFWGMIQSEWIKLRSIRSTWWTYTVLVVITVGLSVQISSSLSFEGYVEVPSQDGMQAAAVNAVMVSSDFTALIVCVLGVLVIAGEYGTGMIRSTFIAVPRRVPALLAKALVFAVSTFLVGALALAITIPISLSLIAGNGIDIRLDDPDYWRAMIGSAGYLALVGLIAFAIGAILRNTAGGIAVALGLILATPLVLGLVASFAPQLWIANLSTLLPSNLGRVLFAHPGYGDWVSFERPDGFWILEPWEGALGLVVWVLVLFTVAIVMLRRRDA